MSESDSELDRCVDCDNEEADIECQICEYYTCADCCVVQMKDGRNFLICRQCYSKQ